MILRAENLIKKYKSRTVVKGVSVEEVDRVTTQNALNIFEKQNV